MAAAAPLHAGRSHGRAGRSGKCSRSTADLMRGIASFKRSTAPSNGMDAQRSVGAPLSSPEAAQRCAEGAGLDSGDPGRSTIGHAVDRAPLQRHPLQTISTNAAAPQPPQLQSRISTSLTDVTANIDLSAFFQHLRTCRCPRSKGGRRNHHTSFGAKRYRDYLVQIGVCRCSVMPEIRCADPALVVDFRRWLQKHRGAAEPTVRQYSRGATELLLALGDDPTRWNAKGVRAHFLERTARCGVGTAEKLVTSLRAFLRYLSVQGRCRADLDKAVPAFTSWRLADLPRYLTAEQVDHLIAACDGRSPERRRDRAIIMLLARLGLRAGDVARLRIADIEWETGTLRVSGKGRYQVRLPLSQD